MKLRFFSKNKVVHENINDHEIVECPICNRKIQPYWEPRYNGVRATCNICKVNWVESQNCLIQCVLILVENVDKNYK